jgi:hypothetical protein
MDQGKTRVWQNPNVVQGTDLAAGYLFEQTPQLAAQLVAKITLSVLCSKRFKRFGITAQDTAREPHQRLALRRNDNLAIQRRKTWFPWEMIHRQPDDQEAPASVEPAVAMETALRELSGRVIRPIAFQQVVPVWYRLVFEFYRDANLLALLLALRTAILQLLVQREVGGGGRNRTGFGASVEPARSTITPALTDPSRDRQRSRL